MDERTQQQPANIEAEQALLGALMIDNGQYSAVAPIIGADHFFEDVHRRLFAAIAKMILAGGAANPVTLRPFLPMGESVGGLSMAAYLARLVAEAVGTRYVRDYARAIREMWVRREAITAARNAIDAVSAMEPGADVLTAVRPFEDRLIELRAETAATADALKIGAHLVESMTAKGTQREAAGIGLVMPEIGEVISDSRFEAGNLYGLLSSSGEGKTSLILQQIRHALCRDHPVLFLSYDQSADQCLQQMIAQEHGIEARRQRQRLLSEAEWNRVFDFAAWVDRMPFRIKKCANETVLDLAAEARSFHRRTANGRAPFIVIDHILAVRPLDPRHDEGTKAASITRPLKALAEELGAAVLILNQRGTAGARRANPRPIGPDLYGGERAKNDYDAVLYLYRAAKWREERERTVSSEAERRTIREVFGETTPEDQAEIGTIKCRFGPLGITRLLTFEGKFTRYASPIRQAVPETMFDAMEV